MHLKDFEELGDDESRNRFPRKRLQQLFINIQNIAAIKLKVLSDAFTDPVVTLQSDSTDVCEQSYNFIFIISFILLEL